MNFEEAKIRAVKYIGISKKTELEVRNKLLRDNIAEEVIDEVIEYIKGIGYIDDVAYAKLFVRQCENECRKSIFEIKIKLLQKGIKEGIIDKELEHLYDNDYEQKVIDVLSSKKFLGKEEEKLKYLVSRRFRGYDESEMYL